MNDEVEAVEQPSNRRGLVVVLLVLWLVTAIALGIVGWNAYFGETQKTQTLAEQIDAACKDGELRDFPRKYRGILCENARKVIEETDPDLHNDEVQDNEIQDPEIQDPENQEREDQEAEIQDPEVGDDEVQDGEINDPDPDDPDPDDPENQDPEIDDPDPASPYDFVFIFTVPGDGLMIPDRTFTVTCNSGNGNCTVQES